jgi:hypothetical protein
VIEAQQQGLDALPQISRWSLILRREDRRMGILALQHRTYFLSIICKLLSIGWPQLDAVYKHARAHVRSGAFYGGPLSRAPSSA